jgi:hypothetical protein
MRNKLKHKRALEVDQVVECLPSKQTLLPPKKTIKNMWLDLYPPSSLLPPPLFLSSPPPLLLCSY